MIPNISVKYVFEGSRVDGMTITFRPSGALDHQKLVQLLLCVLQQAFVSII